MTLSALKKGTSIVVLFFFFIFLSMRTYLLNHSMLHIKQQKSGSDVYMLQTETLYECPSLQVMRSSWRICVSDRKRAFHWQTAEAGRLFTKQHLRATRASWSSRTKVCVGFSVSVQMCGKWWWPLFKLICHLFSSFRPRLSEVLHAARSDSTLPRSRTWSYRKCFLPPQTWSQPRHPGWQPGLAAICG